MATTVTTTPNFPDFKPLGLEDREIFRRILGDYQPETSELTFTNLFIWKDFYNFAWSLERDWLLIISDSAGGGSWASATHRAGFESGNLRQIATNGSERPKEL